MSTAAGEGKEEEEEKKPSLALHWGGLLNPGPSSCTPDLDLGRGRGKREKKGGNRSRRKTAMNLGKRSHGRRELHKNWSEKNHCNLSKKERTSEGGIGQTEESLNLLA